MAPSCGLDGAELRLQLERYRQAGQNASLIERTPKRLVVQLDRHVSEELIERLLTVERSCCPFFTLAWGKGRRRLTVSVSHEEHVPALDAIARALGDGASARSVASD
jgi:hypothetical protein